MVKLQARNSRINKIQDSSRHIEKNNNLTSFNPLRNESSFAHRSKYTNTQRQDNKPDSFFKKTSVGNNKGSGILFLSTCSITFLLAGSSISYCVLVSSPLIAQVVPDQTLPNSSIKIDEGKTSIINGGTQAGGNLFHSFEQFSIPTGGTVWFENAMDIQNIFTRITGKEISNIDGLIRANGTANLFLLNPNGIIFGPNARLNIGGSFLGSTANSIKFADGIEFSANLPQATPLLTVSVPVGLGFGINPASIIVRGNSEGTRSTADLIDTSVGLHVQPKQTLALVGGDIVLEGGTLKTAGGRIELGSVAGSSSVDLTPTGKGWFLGYNATSNLGDIQLSQQSTVDASGEGGGDIQVHGGRLKVTDGSQFEASTLDSEPGGTLNITASDSVELIGTTASGLFPSALFAQVYQGATGSGGNLTIETGKLSVRDGATISTVTLGTGKAGNLLVKASDAVEVVGASSDIQYPSVLAASAGSGITGSGGNLTIETGKLSVRDGAQIQTLTFGTGAAGNLLVKASDAVELAGTVPTNGQLVSGILASADPQATSVGGNAGKVTVETRQLSVRDGARIGVSTFGTSSAGSLSINAKDLIELAGASIDGQSFSTLSSLTTGSGNAGSLAIRTEQLSIKDGAQINLSSTATGNAGNFAVQAQTVNLNQGIITATSKSGEGGDIFLRSRSLQLVKGSSITTDATGGSGNGGNINLDTNLLTLTQGSKITANAVRGNGGNIQIATQGLFQSPDSPITATSQLGFDGNVEFNRIENNPTAGTFELPKSPVDATRLIAQGCPANLPGASSSFTITGRGGLPQNPFEPVEAEFPLLYSRSFAPGENRSPQFTSKQDSLSKDKIQFSFFQPVSYVQADTISRDAQGNVVFSSSAPPKRAFPTLNCEIFDRIDK